MNYAGCLKKLFETNLQGGVKLGLSNMHSLSHFFNHPEKSFKTVHIAGTNGKGSTATKIAKSLEAKGLKVGLFTSPHISSFRERIQINGKKILEDDVLNIMQELFQAVESLAIPATFFELTTMLCLLFFRKKKVDFAVVETGLGGRLDATNIITPEISVITSISFDHMEILGTTLEKIAWEKAGIIKEKVPVVIGPWVPKGVIEKEAQKKKSTVVHVEGEFQNFDEENSAIARKALEIMGISEREILLGIRHRPPCRLELFDSERPIILDVAHNPDGFRKLFRSLRCVFRKQPFHVILGLSKSKDIEECLRIIVQEAKMVYCIEAKSARAICSSELSDRLKQMTGKFYPCFSSIEQAIIAANAQREKNPLLITGSFFIMAEARQALGIKEPLDFYDLNENWGKR